MRRAEPPWAIPGSRRFPDWDLLREKIRRGVVAAGAVIGTAHGKSHIQGAVNSFGHVSWMRAAQFPPPGSLAGRAGCRGVLGNQGRAVSLLGSAIKPNRLAPYCRVIAPFQGTSPAAGHCRPRQHRFPPINILLGDGGGTGRVIGSDLTRSVTSSSGVSTTEACEMP